jgi:hypothetical protein
MIAQGSPLRRRPFLPVFRAHKTAVVSAILAAASLISGCGSSAHVHRAASSKPASGPFLSSGRLSESVFNHVQEDPNVTGYAVDGATQKQCHYFTSTEAACGWVDPSTGMDSYRLIVKVKVFVSSDAQSWTGTQICTVNDNKTALSYPMYCENWS